MNKHAIIIVGPTASGKSDLALEVARQVDGEIINADMGQCYAPLTIGTAKPDLRAQVIPHMLFDIATQPVYISVADYNRRLVAALEDVWQRGKTPLVVGGSLFWVQTLWWPPQEIAVTAGAEDRRGWRSLDGPQQYQLLAEIDAERAQVIHPQDAYRVQRALTIWEMTGMPPSQYAPEYMPFCNTTVFVVQREDSILKERIVMRTRAMLASGWIEEARLLIDTEWEPLVRSKNIIGYPEIFSWIQQGQKQEELPAVAETIAAQTWQYARRQKTYWRSLRDRLTKNRNRSPWHCTVHELSGTEPEASAREALSMLAKGTISKEGRA